MESIINYKKRIASRFIPIEGSTVVGDMPESDEYIYSEKILMLIKNNNKKCKNNNLNF